MPQDALKEIGNKLAGSILSGYWDLVKSLPWWVWIFIAIFVLMAIFNFLMSQERSMRGKINLGIIQLFFDNVYYYFFQRQKILKSGINDLDKMNGHDFEFYLKSLFEKLGYQTTHVGVSTSDHRGDMGGDLIIEKDNIRTAVQAKCYHSFVGIDAVREVIGAMNYYNCSKAIVVTNSNYTNEAITLARVSRVELWNRHKLVEVIPGTK